MIIFVSTFKCAHALVVRTSIMYGGKLRWIYGTYLD